MTPPRQAMVLICSLVVHISVLLSSVAATNDASAEVAITGTTNGTCMLQSKKQVTQSKEQEDSDLDEDEDEDETEKGLDEKGRQGKGLKRRRRPVPAPRTPASECNWQCYLDRYPDLQKAFGKTNTRRAQKHYASHGKREGRDCTCAAKAPSEEVPESTPAKEPKTPETPEKDSGKAPKNDGGSGGDAGAPPASGKCTWKVHRKKIFARVSKASGAHIGTAKKRFKKMNFSCMSASKKAWCHVAQGPLFDHAKAVSYEWSCDGSSKDGEGGPAPAPPKGPPKGGRGGKGRRKGKGRR